MVCEADTLNNSFGAVHLLLQLNPCICCDVIAADSINQSFICGGLTTPCDLELLPQFLQAVLNPFWPGFIHPLDELALISLILRESKVTTIE